LSEFSSDQESYSEINDLGNHIRKIFMFSRKTILFKNLKYRLMFDVFWKIDWKYQVGKSKILFVAQFYSIFWLNGKKVSYYVFNLIKWRWISSSALLSSFMKVEFLSIVL
jgi:hypothetical protein